MPIRWMMPTPWLIVTRRRRRRAGRRPDSGSRQASGRPWRSGLVALVVAAASLWWVLGDRPRPGADPVAPVTPVAPSARPPLPADASEVAPATAGPAGRSSGGSAPGGSSAGASASRAATVVVDVVGRVNRAGVYLLPAGSRVDDAITAAGGLQPGVDASALNLARRLNDGEQIAVGVPGATAAPGAASAGSAGPSGGPASAGPVNLNVATAEQLDALPGVGPVLAKNIVDWRTAHGRFDRIEQLLEVAGIGAAKFATLKTAVTV